MNEEEQYFPEWFITNECCGQREIIKRKTTEEVLEKTTY